MRDERIERRMKGEGGDMKEEGEWGREWDKGISRRDEKGRRRVEKGGREKRERGGKEEGGGREEG